MEESTFYQYIWPRGAWTASAQRRQVLLNQGRTRFGPAASRPNGGRHRRHRRLGAGSNSSTERLLLVSSWDELLAAS